MGSDFFAINRQRLGRELGDGASYVVTGYTGVQRSNDMSFKFEQEANFWWLTGIEKPDWWLIYDGRRQLSIIVAPDVDEIHRIFDGSLDNDRAQMISGADQVVDRREAESILKEIANSSDQIYSLAKSSNEKYYNFVTNPAPMEIYDLCQKTFSSVLDCRLQLARLRAIKQPQEIRAIEQAVDLTVAAFKEIKSKFDEYETEYQIEADFTHFFRSRGSAGHAYDPIVASGLNACTLHYVDNNAATKKDDMVLLDIGARMNGYAADITRTYVPGSASDRQKEIHGAVQQASREIIDLIKPGLSVVEYHDRVDDILRQKIFELGLIAGRNDPNFRKFFPHAISHGLGVDVHDSLGAAKEFAEGMVLTVEPGIYVPEESVGVRIEDDIIITDDGARNLSAELSTEW